MQNIKFQASRQKNANIVTHINVLINDYSIGKISCIYINLYVFVNFERMANNKIFIIRWIQTSDTSFYLKMLARRCSIGIFISH